MSHGWFGMGRNGETVEADEEEEDAEQVGEEFMEDSFESQSSSPSEIMTWISWYVSGVGKEFFTEVSDEFIEDEFNLTGLSSLVPLYKEALDVILDIDVERPYPNAPDASLVEGSAELLYGLIHQRYITSRNGIYQMAEKYEKGHFGHCPRVYCRSCAVVPCGRSDLPGHETVKLFCPSCLDIYVPPNSRFQNVDGAFFGTTFPHLFFQTYRELKPSLPRSGLHVFQPRIYGFKVSERSEIGPRMQWLRSCLKGTDDEEDDLDVQADDVSISESEANRVAQMEDPNGVKLLYDEPPSFANTDKDGGVRESDMNSQRMEDALSYNGTSMQGSQPI